jgi:hypothetical protein
MLRALPHDCRIKALTSKAILNMLSEYTRVAQWTSFADDVRLQALLAEFGSEEENIRHMQDVGAALTAAGHKFELLTMVLDEVNALLVELKEAEHNEQQATLEPGMKTKFDRETVVPIEGKQTDVFVVGWLFAPKHMVKYYEACYVNAGFSLIGIDAAHNKVGLGDGCVGGERAHSGLPCSKQAHTLHARCAQYS